MTVNAADNRQTIDRCVLAGYMKYLVGRFFKILPIRESENYALHSSLSVYMAGLRAELLGYKGLNLISTDNPSFITLICILQYLIDNPDEPISTVKREVFRAISICNKLSDEYSGKCTVGVVGE